MKKEFKLKKLILPLFIIFIMVFSIFGYFSASNETIEKEEYHGFSFVKSDQGWLTYKEDRPLLIQTDPSLLESISEISISLDELNTAQKIYLTFNPQEDIYRASNQLSIQLSSLINTPIVLACTEDVEECSNTPLKTCRDATNSVKVIQFKQSEIPKMSYENNCLSTEGDYQNALIFIDKLTLILNGI